MYGKTVLDLDGDRFEDAIDAAKAAKGVTADVDLDADDLRALVATFKAVVEEETGSPFPQDPREQLRGAVLAVFNSWNSDRAILYRRREQHPHRPRHRRQRAGDGLRQPRRVLRLGRRLHP